MKYYFSFLVALTISLSYCAAQQSVCFNASKYIMPNMDVPRSLATGDFDGDGNYDIARLDYAMSSSSITIQLYKGQGDGSFQQGVSYNVTIMGTEPGTILANDYNKDGKLDLIVSGSYLQVYLGNGDASFNLSGNFYTGNLNGGSQNFIKDADFNSDGNLDVIIENPADINYILFGDGTGAFSQPDTVCPIEACDGIVALGDFDNDGDIDVGSATTLGPQIKLYRNDGTGSFTHTNSSSIGYLAQWGDCQTGDFNKDGIMDIAISNLLMQSPIIDITILLGIGNFTFSSPVYYTYANSNGGLMVLRDFNKDGNLDIAVSNSSNNCVAMLKGVGDGTFTIQNYASGNYPRAITCADYNNDNNLDVVTGNENGHNLLYMQGDGKGAVGSIIYGAATDPRELVTADFNKDGNIDFAVALNLSNSMKVYLGNGNGTFASPANYPSGAVPQGLATADLNNDNNLDIISANETGNSVSIFLGTGSGTFSVAVNYSMGTKPQSVAIADYSGDGINDIATANWTSNNVSVRFGNGDGTFAAVASYSVGQSPSYIAAGDINSDGKIDLIVSNFSSNSISFLSNNGNGTFALPQNKSCGSGPICVKLADLDADGKLDAVTANDGSNNMCVLMGNGTGTFTSVNYPAGTTPSFISIADINSDSKLDIIVCNYNSSNVSVFSGNGNGTFNAPLNFAPGGRSAAVADVNNDLDNDILVAGGYGGGSNGYVTIITSCSSPFPQSPLANFSMSNDTVCAGGCINFTDQSTNSPTSRSWTFQGGSPPTSNQINPTSCFNAAGTYTATLIASNSGGADTITQTITVLTCTGVQQYSESNILTVSPNPTNGIFTVRMSAADCKIELCNVVGEKNFRSATYSLQSIFDISYLPNGIYFLKALTSEGTLVKKIIKE